ncbi:MAG: TolC family protein, partial [Candidatus Krumholzibacteria bacterium]|nr:TolC family protein [Candidatus Krumholzibacteria bacterium]
AVREAEYRLARSREESRAAGAELKARAAEALERCAGAGAEARSIENEVLPVAEAAFAAAQEAYRKGKAGQIEVLDAHRRLAETRLRRIDALEEYHRSLAQIELLTGRRIIAPTGAADAGTQGEDHEREADIE